MNQSILNQRYQLDKQISHKGARHTFLATDLTTQQPVIVKILLFGTDFQWQEYKLFERGSQTLQHLDHPHIPRYLDYFDVTLNEVQGFAQVQRYIEAPSIQEHLDRGRSFSEAEICQIARQLLDILVYLQQLHPPILHRDIKPSNILLGERSGHSAGQVYLVDFDSVKSHSTTPAGQTMTIVGTYGYMAPEQFGGKAYPASDLYGLAATLVAIASGKAPSDLPQKEFRINFEREVNLSPHLVSWLTWLLEPSLDSRAKSASEALTALDNNDRLPFAFKASKVEVKPAGSRIKIKQKADLFKVVLPTQQIAAWEKSQHKLVLIFFAFFFLGPFLILLLLFYV
ncbi:MAG: serine/threonine-protein kinase, partial [Jaaginema sp. PMC 1079.18]|nr:serine/threonine-protein kinase [Jaaginema sp. PMC 1079.18]